MEKDNKVVDDNKNGEAKAQTQRLINKLNVQTQTPQPPTSTEISAPQGLSDAIDPLP